MSKKRPKDKIREIRNEMLIAQNLKKGDIITEKDILMIMWDLHGETDKRTLEQRITQLQLSGILGMHPVNKIAYRIIYEPPQTIETYTEKEEIGNENI